MKACIAILVAVVACANAGYLHGGLYGYAAAPYNYGYAYGYNYPAYSYAIAPAVRTVAYAPAIRTVYAPAPVVRAVHHTAPVVAKTVAAPVAVAAPISVAAPVVRHTYSTPIVRTLAYAPAISYANTYAYGAFGISPYTSAILLKK